MLLCEFEILGKEGRTPHMRDVSTKPEQKEAMVVLSASVEEHGRPRLEFISEMVPVPLYSVALSRLFRSTKILIEQ